MKKKFGNFLLKKYLEKKSGVLWTRLNKQKKNQKKIESKFS